MTLKDKLKALRDLEDIVLYRWVASNRRIAGDYILLSDLRLNALTCSGGSVMFSSAAPVMFVEKNRTMIHFKDSDVLNVTSGCRCGINVIPKFLKQDEDAVVARYCEHREITDAADIPKWLEHRLLSMCLSPAYPVSRVLLPELFRLSKKPETLKPVFNSVFLSAVGATKNDSTEDILSKFRDNLDKFGSYTNEGYVISNDYIATGGCCVCSSSGISKKAGSAVHMMTRRAFEADLARKHWTITTRKDQ